MGVEECGISWRVGSGLTRLILGAENSSVSLPGGEIVRLGVLAMSWTATAESRSLPSPSVS
jgi:hypothetical protein